MKILNRNLRREFAQPGCCELCGEPCVIREGHHLLSCTPELTVRINLISLGSTPGFQCACHSLAHAGKVSKYVIRELVAMREGVSVEDIVAVMEFFRRMNKPTKLQLTTAAHELPVGAFLLAKRELTEARKW